VVFKLHYILTIYNAAEIEYVYSPKKAAEKNTNTKAQTYLNDKNIKPKNIL